MVWRPATSCCLDTVVLRVGSLDSTRGSWSGRVRTWLFWRSDGRKFVTQSSGKTLGFRSWCMGSRCLWSRWWNVGACASGVIISWGLIHLAAKQGHQIGPERQPLDFMGKRVLFNIPHFFGIGCHLDPEENAALPVRLLRPRNATALPVMGPRIAGIEKVWILFPR